MIENVLKRKWGVLLLALVYTSLWGMAFPLVKLCMDELSLTRDLDKCLLAGVRFLISGAALSAVAAIGEKRALPSRRDALSVCAYGALGTAAQYAFTFIGLSRVSGGAGAIFDQLCVFFVVLFGALFLKNESLSAKKIIGCAIGFIGVIAVNAEGAGFSFSLLGEGMMLLAAVCQTGAYFVAAKTAGSVSAIRLVGNGQLIGGALLTVVSLCLGASFPTVSAAGALLILALAAISAVSYVLSLLPLRYFPASEVSVFNLLIPVFGVVFSGLMLGENILKWNYPVSLALIAAGIFIVNHKKKQ